MRKNIVAGNWKMNTTLAEGLALAKGLDEALKGKTPNCDVIIGTPFTHLASVAAAIDTNKIGVAAENCADKEKGAYTGEVSAAMVASTGAKYVILGHSERRAYYHETPEILKTKVELALANGLTPIFCIGEVLEEDEFEPMFNSCETKLSGKKVGLFGSYGWGDGEWMQNWEETCKNDGASLACDSVICNETPDDEAEANCVNLGKTLA